MAKSVLDIVIRLSKQGGADKETITGLVKVKAAMMDAAAVAGTMVAAGYAIKKAFDATVGTMVAYADQVRSISQSTGLTAEESSRLIQVLDDMKISYEDLQKVVQKNGDKFDYSIDGLARMSDEYRSLTSSQEKANFMQERFGKSWVNFVEAMEQGGDRLVRAGEAINGALILDDETLQQAREYEKLTDNLGDAWMAFKVKAGVDAIPFVVRALDILSKKTDEVGLGWAVLSFGFDDLAKIIFGNNEKIMNSERKVEAARMSGLAALYANIDGANAQADALAGLEVNYSDLIGLAQRLSDTEMSYAESVKQVNEDVSLSTDERTAKLDELAAKHSETTQKIISDNLLQKLSVDGLTLAEFDMFVQYQVATGQMTSDAAKQASAINAVTQAVAEGKIGVDLLKEAISLLENKTVTITVNEVRRFAADTARYEGLASLYGYAKGTNGFETVPSGYPNDSYPIGLTSGEKFAVIPAGGGGGAGSGGAGSGGGVVVVNLNMNSVISNMDREAAKNTLIPFIKQGIREAQAQGML